MEIQFTIKPNIVELGEKLLPRKKIDLKDIKTLYKAYILSDRSDDIKSIVISKIIQYLAGTSDITGKVVYNIKRGAYPEKTVISVQVNDLSKKRSFFSGSDFYKMLNDVRVMERAWEMTQKQEIWMELALQVGRLIERIL